MSYYIRIPNSLLARTDRTALQKIVLAYLAFRIGGNGSTWRGERAIADELGIAERTLRRIVTELVALGDVTKVSGGGRTRTNVYRINPDILSVFRDINPDRLSTFESEKPGQVVQETRTDCPKNPDRLSDKKEQIKRTVKRARAQHDIDIEFDKFWRTYPRKVAKVAAEKAWRKLHPGPALVEKIVAAVNIYAGTDQWRRDGGQYIPHPSTFLNQGRWEDELPEVDGSPTPNLPPVERDAAGKTQRDYLLEKFRPMGVNA